MPVPHATHCADNNFFWIENFDMRFQLSIQDTSNPPADGICFVLQNGEPSHTPGIGGTGARGRLRAHNATVAIRTHAHAPHTHPAVTLASADPFIGTTGIGGAGGGFGYAGIQKSVAICLDTYSGTSPNYLATGAWAGGNIQQVSPFLLHVPIANGAW